MTTDERRDLLKAFVALHGIVFSDCVAAFGVDSDTDPFVMAARDTYQRQGEIEIDDTTVLSDSDEGNHVMAWVWVSNEDAGVACDDADEEESEA